MMECYYHRSPVDRDLIGVEGKGFCLRLMNKGYVTCQGA